MSTSQHLEDIIKNKHSRAGVHIVFVDVEKYSKRNTRHQLAVVEAFTHCLGTALTDVSKHYIQYTQNNHLNFATDVIKLPTGDGAAIVFPFPELHDIHLHFACSLLRLLYENLRTTPCETFTSQGWCNCHDHFNLTVGIDTGQAIVFKDLNGHYNVAGSVVNMAARAMGKADRNQILLTDQAYDNLMQMTEDPNLAEHFSRFEVPIKHGEMLTIHQYRRDTEPFINTETPQSVSSENTRDPVIDELLRRLDQPKHELSRRLICDIQGDYTQFSFLADERHKKLAQKLVDKETKESIVESKEQLQDHISSGIISAAKIIFDRARDHFSGRSHTPPRFCVKLVRHVEGGDKTTLGSPLNRTSLLPVYSRRAQRPRLRRN